MEAAQTRKAHRQAATCHRLAARLAASQPPVTESLSEWAILLSECHWGVGRMENKRSQFGDRRQNGEMPRFPFKDSSGVTIKECRRKIPGRRMNRIQGKWIDELVNS
jgi:hypothetical protein